MLVPDVGDHRLQAIKSVDLRVGKAFRVNDITMHVDLDWFNILNAATVLGRSCRRLSPRVQIAPETWHSRPAGSVIVTSPSESGSTVISHRSWRPSTRRAPVTSPPLTVNASSRSVV